MLSCIILAGGHGSRMGYVNKALLKKDNKPFISIIIERILNFSEIGEIIISSNSRELDFLNLPVYGDEVKDIGPLGGLYTTLSKTTNDFALIVPCDTPLLNESIIEKLLSVEDREKYDLIVPRIKGQVEILVGLYSKSLLPSIEEIIQTKHYSVLKLLEKNRIKYVDLNEESLQFLKNVNKPKDFLEIIGGTL